MKYYTMNSYEQIHACLSSATNILCPEKLYLDLTEDCNLYCQMCRDRVSLCGDTMPMGLFQRIVNETAPYVKSYSLFNWGESLLLKDFRERVQYLMERKRPDATIDISTNGMLLIKDTISFLRAMDIIVTVSFDGADKATFERVRRGASFERVLHNAEALAKAYGDAVIENSPAFYVSVQRDNAEQLCEIAMLANRIGIRKVGYGIVTEPEEYAPAQDEKLRSGLEQAYQFINTHGMLCHLYPTKVGDYLFWGDRHVHKSEFKLDRMCNAPLISATIGYSGDVYLCCNIGAVAGNIKDMSFLELWRSEQYNQLREAVNDDDRMPERCKHCAWYNRN